MAASLAAFAPGAGAATREPLSQALASRRGTPFGFGEKRFRPDPAVLKAMTRSSARRYAGAGDEFQIGSGYYGPAAVSSVAATLRSLDHGAEISTLNVYVATPAEIREACGSTVVACYVPSEATMVVSGVDRPVAGVPRDFAIAHEYGHHIANSRQSSALPALEAGTIRWATYERVCQLTRAGRLFPGNQGAHYWEDPEEAFAQSYANLNRPSAGVSWQYTALLRPTAASLAKIHADVSRPWSGPVTTAWSGSVAPQPTHADAAGAGDGQLAIAPAQVAGDPAWIRTRRFATPLDGTVTISLRSTAGAALPVELVDQLDERVLARGTTAADGTTTVTYSNCGHAELRLEVGGGATGGAFEAAITRP